MRTSSHGAWVCLGALLFTLAVVSSPVAGAETFTHRLTESTGTLALWTTTPAQKVFPDDPVPSTEASGIRVWAAQGELEPFVLVARPTAAASLTVTVSGFGGDVAVELFRVDTVNVTTPTDHLGRVGPNPDPLWPLANGATLDFAGGVNTALWIRLDVGAFATPGDRAGAVQIGSVSVPVDLHVFAFEVPPELHVLSEVVVPDSSLATAYGGNSFARWDWNKQNLIDFRLTSRSSLYPTALTSGGAPLVSYDCVTHTLSDPDGIYGFEETAARWLLGTGLLQGTFTEPFHDGVGFPIFSALRAATNDPSLDPRPASFCGLARASGDWYAANDPTSAFNQAWFTYVAAIEGYLQGQGLLERAYHFVANEPQDQADYDAIAWYSRYLDAAAPGIQLMVAEEPRAEIFASPNYLADGQIDIWVPLLQSFDPELSAERLAEHGEATWIYFLPSTRPPYLNPFTLDHPGIEPRLLGWFLWAQRLRGFFVSGFANWSQNPWTTPASDGQNGALSLIYPPTNPNAPGQGATTSWVPSIRLELIRDGLEDYEYLRLYAGDADPQPGVPTDADAQAAKLIRGVVSSTDDPEFLYEVRRQLGLYLGGEIEALPDDLLPPPRHPRAAAAPTAYFVNFQNPAGLPATTKIEDTWGTGFQSRYVALGGHDYLQVGTETYSLDKGYGWRDDTTHFLTGRNTSTPETDERKITWVTDDYADHPSVFDFDLPNGVYRVEVGVGTPNANRLHNRVVVEGVPLIDDEASTPSLVRSTQVEIIDSRLTLEIGIKLEYTMIDYLIIEPDAVLFADAFEAGNVGAWNLAVGAAPPPQASPFFSEYVEGSSSNKAVEIYNPGPGALDLSACQVRIYFNGATSPGGFIQLSGTVASSDVHVACDDGIAEPGRCDTLSPISFFNGNDVVELTCGGVSLDFIGQVGFDPVSGWEVGGVGTQNATLRRACSVTRGDDIGVDPFDPSLEWIAFPQDLLDGLGTYDCP